MGNHPHEGSAINIYPHLLKGIASKGLDYDIIGMIVLSVLHDSNKITLSWSTHMWVLPLETINFGYWLSPFLGCMPSFSPNKCILHKSTYLDFSHYMHTWIFEGCPQTFYDTNSSKHTPTLMLIKYKAREI